MSSIPEQLTAADISRLAGVTRATVSNWRRRHADFPQPSGGSKTSPTYDRQAVEAWLAARGQLPKSSDEDVRAVLRMFDDLVAKSLVGHTPEDTDPSERLQEASRRLRANLDRLNQQELAPAMKRVIFTRTSDLNRRISALLQDSQWSAPGHLRTLRDTPEPVADLMATLIERRPYPASVFDPACDSGTLLVAAGRRGATKLLGQALSSPIPATLRIHYFASKAETQIRVGDSLRQDAFPLLTADAVLCDPPYGERDWGHDELGYDSRWEYGLPPKKEPELAWVQHCLSHLKPGGLAAILLPPAVAERPGGRRIRTELVRRGALRAIIALPPGAARPRHIGLHVWVLQRPTAAGSDAPPVLFLDATDVPLSPWTSSPAEALSETVSGAIHDVAPRSSEQEELHDVVLQHWRRFRDAPNDFATVPGVARAVATVDLLGEDVDLTPGRHVRAVSPPVDPDQYAKETRATRLRLRRALDMLEAASASEDWQPIGTKAAEWRTATVADLQRGGAIELHRAATIASRKKRDAHRDGSTGQDDFRVLTLQDVISDRAASGAPTDAPADVVKVRFGDVILPDILREGLATARVAEDRDVGTTLGPHLHLIRPDLNQIDPWFLALFLSAEENLNSTAVGSTIVRIRAHRLRVPLLPPDEQRRYGKAFQRMIALLRASTLAARLAKETARQHITGLTSGALRPPDD